MNAYEDFICASFDTYAGIGADAQIRSMIRSIDGDRREHAHYTWKAEWNQLFVNRIRLDRWEYRGLYNRVVSEFQRTIGIVPDPQDSSDI